MMAIAGWILWLSIYQSGPPLWSLIDAYETLKECKTQAVVRIEQSLTSDAKERKITAGNAIVSLSSKSIQMKAYCLPSGTDPRPSSNDVREIERELKHIADTITAQTQNLELRAIKNELSTIAVALRELCGLRSKIC